MSSARTRNASLFSAANFASHLRKTRLTASGAATKDSCNSDFEFSRREEAVQHHLMRVENLGQPRVELLAYEPGGFLQFGFHLQHGPANSLHFGLNLLRPDPNGLRAAFQNVSSNPSCSYGKPGRNAHSVETLFLARKLWNVGRADC